MQRGGGRVQAQEGEAVRDALAALFVQKRAGEVGTDPALLGNGGVVQTAEGGGELEKTLSDLLGTSDFDPSAAALTSERQRSCCVRALDSIKDALSALESGVTLDAVNVCADCAVDALLELTGERASEAVVSEVFSQFCVGK